MLIGPDRAGHLREIGVVSPGEGPVSSTIPTREKYLR